jgi:hypothetical protein
MIVSDEQLDEGVLIVHPDELAHPALTTDIRLCTRYAYPFLHAAPYSIHRPLTSTVSVPTSIQALHDLDTMKSSD